MAMTATRHPFNSEELALHERMAALTLKSARPLIWHDVSEPWPKRLLGGTCFILRFNAGLIGITAAHVVGAFEEAVRRNFNVVSLLRTVHFDLKNAIIDRDESLDIATFGVTEDQLIESQAIAIDCRSEWPPPTPDRGTALSVSGFPEVFVRPSSYDRTEFRAYVSLTHVEDITDRDIISTYEPERDFRVRTAAEIPDLGANLSGCSGGPVLMHAERNGLHRWFPVGLVVRGPRASNDDVSREFDVYQYRRIHFVDADGFIKHQRGWLP
jgi:hypothetical protein